MTGPADVCAAALEWQAAGACVIPTRSDGTAQSKAPAGRWRHYGKTAPAPDAAAIRAWFGNGSAPDGLGVLCGAVSGNLDMFEFEGRAVAEGLHGRYSALLDQRGLLPLWQRITAGYCEQTPSGGVHVQYRLDGPVPGNTKLASRPARDDELTDDERKLIAEKREAGHDWRPRRVLIETRGEGGFTVVALSGGRTHPTGRPWVLLSGGPGTVATITRAERDALCDAARDLDQMPAHGAQAEQAASGELRPVQTSSADRVSWRDILEPHGWVYVADDEHGDQLWRRPGKDGGWSASTRDNGGLYVWTTSTEFEAETPYSKAAVSAVLNDGMDPAGALAAYGTAQEASAAEEEAILAGWGTSSAEIEARHAGSNGEPITDADEADGWARRQLPASFIDPREGLLAVALGKAVLHMGPLAAGIDDRMWEYRHGVYRAAKTVVDERVVKLLSDRYRPSYGTNAEHVVRTFAPSITSEPVERYLNVPNGLLDWRAGELYAHSPGVLSTVQLGAEWQPDAVCPVFDWWLPQVVPPDCVELIWELIGYLAYSGNPLHAAVMLAGDGRNGKGTLLRVILAILGAANVTAVSLADLVSTRFTTASLFGKIANIAGDIDATYMENTAVFKAITGGDLISAEHKGGDRFDFVPWAVPVFSANKIPASADTTAGYLSRWLVIPFPNSFAGREDRTIEGRLHAELPGILAGGVRRLPALLARGQFGLTDSAREAKADFSRKVDQVRYWLHECCELGGYPLTNRTRLYQAYKMWVLRDGGKPLKAGEFYDRLAAAGVQPGVLDGTRGFRGIRITDECILSASDFRGA